MAYGDNRNLVASDTFDSSIDAAWTNGRADWATWSHNGDGTISPSASDSQIQRNTGTYTDDHYSVVTMAGVAAAGFVCASGRGATGATDESCYIAVATDYSAGSTPDEWGIEEVSSAFGFSTLTSGALPNTLSTGETVTLECEGTTLRMGSNQGAGDAQRGTTTDATLTTGWPGICGGNAGHDVTAWSGGSIGAAGGAVIPAASMYYARLRR
jgi:hypothetical protein